MINGVPHGYFTPNSGHKTVRCTVTLPVPPVCRGIESDVGYSSASKYVAGYEICKELPSRSAIYYLLMILYSSANQLIVNDAQCMAQILRRHEHVLGHKVNLEKSSIIFGMKIDNVIRGNIHNILHIRGGKYLGLPEQLGRSKVTKFEGIVNQIKAQINLWYNQFLSQAGKEVLIKSVLQAKPVYPMNCFLLPKTNKLFVNRVLVGT